MLDFLNFIGNWPIAVIIILYAVLAFGVVMISLRLSKAVDNLDKLTNIGGALIGGVFLAAVTSLPEMFTSISATLIDQPGLVFGNMLGSNVFNMFVLGIVDIIFIRKMFINHVKSMRKTTIFTIAMYAIVLIPLLLSLFTNNVFEFIGFQNYLGNINFSIITILIIILYVISIKSLATERPEEKEEETLTTDEKTRKQQVKHETMIFIILALVLVIVSVVITKTVDFIEIKLNLGKSVAGALFLGIATSLPEMTSLINLVRLNNFDAAYGDIVGSNLFNFTILTVVDIIYTKQDLFVEYLANGTEKSNISFLLIFGLIQLLLALFALIRKKPKNKFLYLLPSILISGLYIAYLVISFM